MSLSKEEVVEAPPRVYGAYRYKAKSGLIYRHKNMDMYRPEISQEPIQLVVPVDLNSSFLRTEEVPGIRGELYFDIISIRDLISGDTISIGEKVTIAGYDDIFTVQKFFYSEEGELCATHEERKILPTPIRVDDADVKYSPSPALFRTEDKVNIQEGDKYYEVFMARRNENYSALMPQIAKRGFVPSEDGRYFYEKENALRLRSALTKILWVPEVLSIYRENITKKSFEKRLVKYLIER